jgi:hypothetical protein
MVLNKRFVPSMSAGRARRDSSNRGGGTALPSVERAGGPQR